MVWRCEKGRGGVLSDVGEVRVGGQWPMGKPGLGNSGVSDG